MPNSSFRQVTAPRLLRSFAAALGPLAASAGFALAVACASDRTPTTPVRTAAVTVADFSFSPASVVVQAGATVTWTNTGNVAHTTTSTAAGWDSGTMAKGATFSHAFPTKGTFSYRCSFHPNMTGTITVQ